MGRMRMEVEVSWPLRQQASFLYTRRRLELHTLPLWRQPSEVRRAARPGSLGAANQGAVPRKLDGERLVRSGRAQALTVGALSGSRPSTFRHWLWLDSLWHQHLMAGQIAPAPRRLAAGRASC